MTFCETINNDNQKGNIPLPQLCLCSKVPIRGNKRTKKIKKTGDCAGSLGLYGLPLDLASFSLFFTSSSFTIALLLLLFVPG